MICLGQPLAYQPLGRGGFLEGCRPQCSARLTMFRRWSMDRRWRCSFLETVLLFAGGSTAFARRGDVVLRRLGRRDLWREGFQIEERRWRMIRDWQWREAVVRFANRGWSWSQECPFCGQTCGNGMSYTKIWCGSLEGWGETRLSGTRKEPREGSRQYDLSESILGSFLKGEIRWTTPGQH